MDEFIKELEYNQNINFKKGLENRIDIDYVIERLKDIKKSKGKTVKKIKNFENVINENKSGFFQIMVLYNMSCHYNYIKMTDEEKEKVLGFIYNLYMKDETRTDLATFSDLVMNEYKKVIDGTMTRQSIYELIY